MPENQLFLITLISANFIGHYTMVHLLFILSVNNKGNKGFDGQSIEY